MNYSVAQIGARRHYAVPEILNVHNKLDTFYTDFVSVKGPFKFLHYYPETYLSGALKKMKSRQPTVNAKQITAFIRFGLLFQLKHRMARNADSLIKTNLWAGKTFNNLVLKNMVHNSDGFYTFNSAGLEILKYCQLNGKAGILDQTIAPKEYEIELLSEEQQLHPDWAEPVHNEKYLDSFIEREKSEWEYADKIICGSQFVKDGVEKAGGPVEKCSVVPYGVNFNNDRSFTQDYSADGPLRVLTVGNIGIRKGSPYVLEAAKHLKDQVHFRMVGGMSVPENIKLELKEHLELTGQVPRDEVAEHYEWADLFLLPSIVEGSATVTYEAISYGLPVICTTNTGSVVTDSKDGFIVPIRDVEAIVSCINRLNEDRGLLSAMSENAENTSNYNTLDEYGKRLIKAVS